MEYSPEIINKMFVQGLDTPEHTKEAQTVFGTYVRDKLREMQFSRKILNVKAVTNTDFGIQRSTTHDGLVYMDEVEPESGARALTWTTMPDVQYVKQKRYEIPFFQVGSRNYQVTEQELWASVSPVYKLIQDNTVKDMATIEDWRFLTLCELAVAQTGMIVKGTATTSGAASGDIEMADIINLKNILTNKQRRGVKLLVNETDFNKLLKWSADDVGFNARDRIVYGKYVPNNLFDLEIITSIKTDLLQEGNIWLFTSPEYLGRFLTLGNTRFDLEKRRDIISWSSWEFIGQSIANIYSVAKLEIYDGASSAIPDQDTLFRSLLTTPPSVFPVVVGV